MNTSCGFEGSDRLRDAQQARQEFGSLYVLVAVISGRSRYLSENQIGDVPTIVGALVRLRGFAHIEAGTPVIRRGKSGHFYDKGLEGVAITPSSPT
jgi:hypothetical protein